MFVSVISILAYGSLPLKITVPLMNVDSLWSVIWLIVCLVYTTVVIGLSNPMFGVLTLILVFLSAAFFIATLKFYFLSFLIIFIYVGAISVLFIFTLMIIPIKSFLKYKHFFEQFRVIYYFIFLYFIVNVFLFFSSNNFITLDLLYLSEVYNGKNYIFNQLYFVHNDILALGIIIYTYYFFHFSLISLILLSGMVTAVVIVIEKFFVPKKQKDSIFEYELFKDLISVLDYRYNLVFKKFKIGFSSNFKNLSYKMKNFLSWFELNYSKNLFNRIQDRLDLLEKSIARKWTFFITLLILFFIKLKKIIYYICNCIAKIGRKVTNYTIIKFKIFISILLYSGNKIVIIAKFLGIGIVYFYEVYSALCVVLNDYYECISDWIRKKLGLPTHAELRKKAEEDHKKREEEGKKRREEYLKKKITNTRRPH